MRPPSCLTAQWWVPPNTPMLSGPPQSTSTRLNTPFASGVAQYILVIVRLFSSRLRCIEEHNGASPNSYGKELEPGLLCTGQLNPPTASG